MSCSLSPSGCNTWKITFFGCRSSLKTSACPFNVLFFSANKLTLPNSTLTDPWQWLHSIPTSKVSQERPPWLQSHPQWSALYVPEPQRYPGFQHGMQITSVSTHQHSPKRLELLLMLGSLSMFNTRILQIHHVFSPLLNGSSQAICFQFQPGYPSKKHDELNGKWWSFSWPGGTKVSLKEKWFLKSTPGTNEPDSAYSHTLEKLGKLLPWQCHPRVQILASKIAWEGRKTIQSCDVCM